MKYILSIKNDDIAAFEQVYFEYYEKLYSYYLRKTQSVFIAEELAQETFIKLWIYRKTLSEEVPIAAQIFRIAKTIFIDTLKKKKLEIISIEEVYNFDKGGGQFDTMATREFAKLVSDSIETLPPIRKKVFKLSRENGMSHQEIAQMLAISPKSVNNHITKAIKQLKQLISQGSILLIICDDFINKYF